MKSVATRSTICPNYRTPPVTCLCLQLLLACRVLTSAATYSGNGDSGFSGAIGAATLSLSDKDGAITGSLKKGNGSFNDVLVLYIDSVSGGFSDTSDFGDGADGLRKAISGFD